MILALWLISAAPIQLVHLLSAYDASAVTPLAIAALSSAPVSDLLSVANDDSLHMLPRERAVVMLAEFPATEASLLALTTHAEARLRVRSLIAIRRLLRVPTDTWKNDPLLQAALERRLDDDDVFVRVQASRALSFVASKRSLLATHLHFETDPRVRDALAEALQR